MTDSLHDFVTGSQSGARAVVAETVIAAVEGFRATGDTQHLKDLRTWSYPWIADALAAERVHTVVVDEFLAQRRKDLTPDA